MGWENYLLVMGVIGFVFVALVIATVIAGAAWQVWLDRDAD